VPNNKAPTVHRTRQDSSRSQNLGFPLAMRPVAQPNTAAVSSSPGHSDVGDDTTAW